MNNNYLIVLLFSFLIGAVAAIATWGPASLGGDDLILARFLTAAGVMGIGHCSYKLVFDWRKARY